jgi:hypothetical protein
VRHVGKEFGLVLVRGFELKALLLDFTEQPRVLNGDHRLVGEGLEQRDFLVGKRSSMLAADEDRADAFAFPEHRGIDHGPDSHGAAAFADELRD